MKNEDRSFNYVFLARDKEQVNGIEKYLINQKIVFLLRKNWCYIKAVRTENHTNLSISKKFRKNLVFDHINFEGYFPSRLQTTFAIRLGFSTPDGCDRQPIIFNETNQ